MDDFPTDEFDAIVLGTGLKECILSGLMSVAGKKVLHLDRNDYYGADSASLNLQQLYKNYSTEEKVPEDLGRARDYSIDLCPKFIIGCGDMVKMLIKTKVTRYLQFKHVGASFVFHSGKLYAVPVTAKAALTSSLIGVFQRVRVTQFFSWVSKWEEGNEKTWGDLKLKEVTMRQVFDHYKCDENTRTFTGHAIALYTDDSYLDNVKQTIPCLKRIQMYAFSLARYVKSPYIYPVYGLGGLPEGFSRLAAVHGGTFMLRFPLDRVVYGEDGKVTGIETKGNFAKLKKGGVLIGDPSYFMNTLESPKPKIKKSGRVARWICILDHPVPGTGKVPAESAQIILPATRIKRPSDIYITVMSSALCVAPKGFYTAMISSNVYTDKPKQELAAAYKLLGTVKKDFFYVTDTYFPINKPKEDNVFIPSSMDATTHFESASREVQLIYKLITGEPVDLSAKPEVEEAQ